MKLQKNFGLSISQLLILFVFFLLTSFIIKAQEPKDTKTFGGKYANEIDVSVLQRIGSRHFRCYGVENKIVDEQTLNEIIKDEKCSYTKLLNVDFAKHSLISYKVGGDCFIKADAKVFRNDETKIYKVVINNYWGRCRAGGSFQCWLVIDKIPSDFQVEFEERLIDKRENDFIHFGLTTNVSKAPAVKYSEFIESEQVDLKGCIQMYRQKKFVIKDRESYLQNIRNDAQTQSCTEYAENLEFEKYSYIGMEINSGYCRMPIGLKHNFIKDNSKKQYVLTVSYDEPQGVCRALSQYALWLRVPKLTEDFDVDFVVEPKMREKEN